MLTCHFQIIKQPFQICMKPLALVPVISHSKHVTSAAAVTRYRHYFFIRCLNKMPHIVGKCVYFNTFSDDLSNWSVALNRTALMRSWSCLRPNVCQGLMVGKSLLMLITNAPCSLKTPQIGFHFYVSPLHLKTTHSLGSFIKETQCKMSRKQCLLNYFQSCVCVTISLTSLSCFFQYTEVCTILPKTCFFRFSAHQYVYSRKSHVHIKWAVLHYSPSRSRQLQFFWNKYFTLHVLDN